MRATAPAPNSLQQLVLDLSEELAALTAHGLLRRSATLESADGPVVRIDGRDVVCWCSNDYLGLAGHPALAKAAADAAAEWGVGARASRLLSGSTAWHGRLETELAGWFQAEAALVYPSGYQANLGTLGALLSSSDAVGIDRLAHASLWDAIRASRAAVRVFRHHDVDDARQVISRAAGARRRLLVTEGVFSMDGDTPPLAALLEVAEAQDALLYLDDAHGAFVLGASGRGTPEAAGVAPERLLYIGTLGKALGCQGGFVVGPQVLIDYLRNRARTFIYTTALATPVAAAAVAALAVVRQEPQRRQQLSANVRLLHDSLGPLAASAQASHIVPVIVGEAAAAVELSRRLWERGIWAPAIRPPTVPEGAARLRLSVTAIHTSSQIAALGQALRESLEGLSTLPRLA